MVLRMSQVMELFGVHFRGQVTKVLGRKVGIVINLREPFVVLQKAIREKRPASSKYSLG